MRESDGHGRAWIGREERADAAPARAGGLAAPRGMRMATLAATLAAFAAAVRALARSAPLALAGRPGTPLRVLCIAAMDYLAARRGERLGASRRRALAVGLDLGALLNDHFDQGRFDVAEYRALRRELGRGPLAREAFRRYRPRVAALERGRPRLAPFDPADGLAGAVSAYRRAVLEVSLDFVTALARGGPAAAAARDPLDAPLLKILELLQLADDLLDFPRDEAARLPSHVTALTRPGAPRAEAEARLRRLLDQAYASVGPASPDASPLRAAAWLVRAVGLALLAWRAPALRRSPGAGSGSRATLLIVGSGGPLGVRRERLADEPRARLLYASDLHLRRGNQRPVASRLIAVARRERPDAVLLGGDLVDTRSGLEALTGLVSELRGVAVVAAVEGNHDRWVGVPLVRAAVERGGGRWLADAPLTLARGLTVYGGLPAGPVPEGSVLCAHHPAVFDRACAAGFGVVLAGHLHGGQLVLGQRGGLLYPGAFLYRYNGLRFARNGTTMLVSRGVHDTLPLRWNCPREVLLVEV